MAKIFLNIEATDATDFYDTLEALANGPRSSIGGEYGETIALTQEIAETGEQTAKRTRRTKAQIEADNASAAGQQASPSSTTTAQPSASDASTSGAVDPFADQIKRSADEPGFTQVQVRAAATKFMGSHTAKELQAILQEHGDAPNIGAVDPSKYAAVVAALEAAG